MYYGLIYKRPVFDSFITGYFVTVWIVQCECASLARVRVNEGGGIEVGVGVGLGYMENTHGLHGPHGYTPPMVGVAVRLG